MAERIPTGRLVIPAEARSGKTALVERLLVGDASRKSRTCGVAGRRTAVWARVSRLALGCMSYGEPGLGTHPWSLPEEDRLTGLRSSSRAAAPRPSPQAVSPSAGTECSSTNATATWAARTRFRRWRSWSGRTGSAPATW